MKHNTGPTDKKIKLMHITHDLAIGGLQQVIVNICRVIDRNQFDVSVLCLRTLGEFTSEIKEMGIDVILLPQKKKGTDYFAFYKIAQILKNMGIDIIHTHNTQPFVEGTLAAILSGVKTIIHTDHARSFPDKKRYMIAEWIVSHYAKKIVGVSEHTSNNLIKYEKINPDKIITIANGIDENKYDPQIDRKAYLKDLGVESNGFIIGLCVRLTEQKGITYLLQSMPQVLKKFPDLHLIVVGTGNLEEDLKKEAFELGINGSVIFTGPRLDIPELLKLFDLYVMPSLWEGLPMVLIEAMAAKCPIVATNVGGIGTAIENKNNGLLVKEKHPEQLAKAIIEILEDEETRTKYAEEAYRTYKRMFSAEIMVGKYQDLYLATRN